MNTAAWEYDTDTDVVKAVAKTLDITRGHKISRRLVARLLRHTVLLERKLTETKQENERLQHATSAIERLRADLQASREANAALMKRNLLLTKK